MNAPANDTAALGKNATTFGIIALVLGILAMLAPTLVGASLIMILGVIVSIAGVARMLWSFRSRDLGKGILRFALGVLTLICGFALFANPMLGSGILTILLAIYLVADGLFEIAVGWSARSQEGSGWWMFTGALSVLLGILMVLQGPSAGAWFLGFLLGLKLILIGWMMIRGGRVLKRLA